MEISDKLFRSSSRITTLAKQIITLEDGIRIEAESTRTEVSMNLDGTVKQTIEAIGPMLEKVVRPIKAMWNDVSEDLRVDKVEVEIGFGIQSSGNFFVVSSTGNANLKVKLSITRDKSGA